MADLSKFVVTNREGDDSFVPDPIPEPTPDPTPSPEPSPDPVPDPAPSPDPAPPAPVNDFPSERFEGKFKSWDELVEFTKKPAPEPQKFDEPLQKLIDKYLIDGDLTEYFRANSVDYDKLSDEEVVRRDFFAKNSDLGLSVEAANKLWEKELAKFKLDPEEHDSTDVEIASAMMKREASKLREAGKESQKAYLVPSRQVAPKASVDDLAKAVHAMPEAQSMKSGKSISFKSGDSVINYGVNDVDGALNLMANEEAFGALFLENGRPNIDKWVRMVEFVRNEDAIIKTIFDQGLAAGQKIIENEIKNPQIHTPRPDKFNGSTIKERFISTLAQQQGLTN